MAGIIVAFGVIYADVTLVVGAMAISPDTMELTTAATALILRRWRLAGRTVVAPIGGLGLACLVGGLVTRALSLLDLLRNWFEVGQSAVLAGLSTVDMSTPIVAFAAAVAGILASSAVGVAISVTTIPAFADLGVAAWLGEVSKALGELLVGVNVAMLLVGGFATLIVQRMLPRRMPGSTTVR